MRERRAVLIAVAFGLVGCDSGPGKGTGAGTSPADCDDTSSDTYHCGACDHTCWGGACIGGVCQPRVVSGATYTAAEGSVAVIENVGGVRLDSYRFAHGLHFDPEFQVGVGESGAIEGDWVYAGRTDGIYKCDVDGRVPCSVVVTAGGGVNDSLATSSMAVTGETLVYAAPYSNTTPPSLLRCVGDCVTPETIYTGTSVGFIKTVRAEGSILAFVDGLELRLCDINNCQATVRTLSSAVVSFFPYIPNLVAVGPDLIAWREYTVDDRHEPSRVMACAPADCATPVELFRTEAAMNGLAVNAGLAYAGITDTPGFVRCPAAGCGGVPEPVTWTVEMNDNPTPADKPTPSSAPVLGQIFVTDKFYILGSAVVTL